VKALRREAQQERNALPMSAGWNEAPITSTADSMYIVPLLLALCRLYRFTYFPELAYKIDSTDRKQKYGMV
jgi:hypothetical protein